MIANTIGHAQKNQPAKYGSGWFNHVRAATGKEVADSKITWSRLGCLEKKRRKRKAEEMKASRAQSSGNEPRSVSVSQSEEPDRKQLKKEQKEEDKRKKAEAEAGARKKEEDARKKRKQRTLEHNCNPNRISSCTVIFLMRRLDAKLRRASRSRLSTRRSWCFAYWNERRTIGLEFKNVKT